jgi:hypothetical protein
LVLIVVSMAGTLAFAPVVMLIIFCVAAIPDSGTLLGIPMDTCTRWRIATAPLGHFYHVCADAGVALSTHRFLRRSARLMSIMANRRASEIVIVFLPRSRRLGLGVFI